MKVIVLTSFRKLGAVGSIVDVKPGYAKNYLVPMGIVEYATKTNLQKLEVNREEFVLANSKMLQEATVVKGILDDSSFFIVRAASEDGRLYGSVTARDVLDEVNKRLLSVSVVFSVKPGNIDLGVFGVKAIGLHSCKINLHGDITAEVSVNVCRTVAEGEVLAKKSLSIETSSTAMEDFNDTVSA